MVLPPFMVLQWLLVGILHQEIIAHISELRTHNLLFGLDLDENHFKTVLMSDCDENHKKLSSFL